MHRSDVHAKFQRFDHAMEKDIWGQWNSGDVDEVFWGRIMNQLVVTNDLFDPESADVTQMALPNKKNRTAYKKNADKKPNSRGRRKRLKEDAPEEPHFDDEDLQDLIEKMRSHDNLDRLPTLEQTTGERVAMIDLPDGSQITFTSSKNHAKEQELKKKVDSDKKLKSVITNTTRKIEHRVINRFPRVKQSNINPNTGITPILNGHPNIGVLMDANEASIKNIKKVKGSKIVELTTNGEIVDYLDEINQDRAELGDSPIQIDNENGVNVPGNGEDMGPEETGVPRLHWNHNRVIQERNPKVVELVSVGNLNPGNDTALSKTGKPRFNTKGKINNRSFVQEASQPPEIRTTTMLGKYINGENSTHPLLTLLMQRTESREQGANNLDFDGKMRMHALVDVITYEEMNYFLTEPGIGERRCVNDVMCEGMRVNVRNPIILKEYMTQEDKINRIKNNGRYRNPRANQCFLCILKFANEAAMSSSGNTSTIDPKICTSPFRMLLGADGEFSRYDCIFPQNNGLMGPLLIYRLDGWESTTVVQNGTQLNALRYISMKSTNDNRVHFQTESGKL